MGVYDERRVKIVATLGPASRDRDTLRELFLAGLDVVRINAAHGTPDERAALVSDVRSVADEVDKLVPILFDLRGLKIRTGSLANPEEETVGFARGDSVIVVNTAAPTTPEVIGIDYRPLFDVINVGSRILISDGLIELLVERIEGEKAYCLVGRGGHLHGRQGVTLPEAMIKGGSLTPVDREDLQWGVEQGVDFIGLSFVSDAADLHLAREVAGWYGSRPPQLIAKIERPQALANVRSIASAADGLMVARGDLGVQMPPERVPRAQKEIISVANEYAMPVITATQMLESMIRQPVATRAETSDVANAVWDGTDAVMLSAETAIGQYPVEAVRTMGRIIREAERDGPIRTKSAEKPLPDHSDTTLEIADAIARATRELADDAPIGHIVVFTQTGASVRRIAKYRPKPPIVGMAADIQTARRLNLIWGVRGGAVPIEENPDHLFREAGKMIVAEGMATDGEFALIAGSLPMTHLSGRTNMLHVRRLGT